MFRSTLFDVVFVVILGVTAGLPTINFAANPSSASGRKETSQPVNDGTQVKIKVLRQDEYNGKLDGKKTTATMVEVTLEPLAGSPPHRHPGPVSGYVLEGTLEFQVEGGPVRILKAGDSFYEPKMILHLLGRNPDREKQTRILATIVHPSDAKSIMIMEPMESSKGKSQKEQQ